MGLSTIHKSLCSLYLFLTLLSTSSVECFNLDDQFEEELLIKPLNNDFVYAYFQFTTTWDVPFEAKSFQNCHLFPRVLGEVLGQYSVQELHLSLTQGLWRHEKYGYPVIDAPAGTEIWAWFKEGTKDVNKSWKMLTSALSGLFCASLNFVEPHNTLSPTLSFAPTGAVPPGIHSNSSLLRYSTLPREVVCTENLTPWKKLLPCDSKRGLATLLNAGHIYNTNYHSLGIHVRPICKDIACESTAVELKQTVSLVYDMLQVGSQSRDWSFRKLFGQGLSGPCPLASSSRVYVDTTQNGSIFEFQLRPEPKAVLTSIRGGATSKLAMYDLKTMHLVSLLNIAATYTGEKLEHVNISPVLYANRYIIGYGQENGGIVTKVVNNHWQPLDIVYMENIPWFLPVYLHTFQAEVNGRQLVPHAINFVPGRERERPYQLEVALRIPARSTTTLSISFDYIFLKWQEYPPDANHGFYVGAAVITSSLPVARNYTGVPYDGSTLITSINATRSTGYPVQVRTEIILVSLPTPDFSMPYNVICLACTVVALAFGPLHNITTKRLLLKDLEDNKSFFERLKEKLKRGGTDADKVEESDEKKKSD
ncbi:GPI transamidase component PIG-T [Cloeon dipterum]|uniref:GPI transamidase component PIG-T n=1 Tax=Cloeon dipterum TaxID=197152 RepID=UPI0032207B68